MGPNSSQSRAAQSFERRPPTREVDLQLRHTLKAFYDLLEEHAPSWYPQELHDRTEELLQLLEK